MADPVLLLHRADQKLHVYATGSVQSPASIRDQMIRGRWIVERAVDAGLIHPAGRLVVAGAGAGGVTAAMTAERLGVPVVLVDRDEKPFSRQRKCKTRYVEPALYDWALPRHDDVHWGAPQKMPLAYSAGFIDSIVTRDFDTQFNQKSLGFTKDSMVSKYSESAGKLFAEITNVKTGAVSAVECQMILYATGGGDEQVTVGAYKGYRFWDNDPYGATQLTPSGKPATILVSGGGDGALQDLIRLLTDSRRVQSPRHLWKAIEPLVPATLLLRIQEAEEQTQRALLWSGTKQKDCEILRALEYRYIEVLRDLHSQFSAIENAIASKLRTPVPTLALVHPCNHFSRCYALNHFLVLLLLELLRNRGVSRIAGHGLSDVAPTAMGSHTCTDAGACHGNDHDVTLVDKTCVSEGTNAPVAGNTSNVIVVRHGTDSKALVSPAGPVPLKRQLLPYDFI